MLGLLTIMGMMIIQAVNPLPRRTVAPGSTGRAAQQLREAYNTSPAPARPFDEKPQTSGTDRQENQRTIDDPERSVKLTSLPPITFAKNPKTYWDRVFDWGPWAFDLLLVIVGALQVMLLSQTRKEIHAQADLMSRQAKDAREQQRAKLEVLFPPATPQFPANKSLPETDIKIDPNFRVANYGYSEAFKVVAFGQCVITSDPKAPVTSERRLNIPSVINKMTSPATVETTDAIIVKFAPEGTTASFKQSELDKVLSRLSHMRLVGSIKYVDVYGDAHVSPFDFLWVVKDVTENGLRIDKSGWLNQSGPTT